MGFFRLLLMASVPFRAETLVCQQRQTLQPNFRMLRTTQFFALPSFSRFTGTSLLSRVVASKAFSWRCPSQPPQQLRFCKSLHVVRQRVDARCMRTGCIAGSLVKQGLVKGESTFCQDQPHSELTPRLLLHNFCRPVILRRTIRRLSATKKVMKVFPVEADPKTRTLFGRV